jgi:hypothetical protein
VQNRTTCQRNDFEEVPKSNVEVDWGKVNLSVQNLCWVEVRHMCDLTLRLSYILHRSWYNRGSKEGLMDSARCTEFGRIINGAIEIFKWTTLDEVRQKPPFLSTTKVLYNDYFGSALVALSVQ